MSILSGLMGHASGFDAGTAQAEFEQLLCEGETVQAAFKLVRDVFLFTERRMILVDKQGMLAEKVEYMSLPYRSIVRFSIESAGAFGLDAELKVWVSGSPTPIGRTFNKNLDVYGLQKMLASHVAR
jgi:Bacterial PH domain